MLDSPVGACCIAFKFLIYEQPDFTLTALEKFVYYAHAWHLKLYNKPLIKDYSIIRCPYTGIIVSPLRMVANTQIVPSVLSLIGEVDYEELEETDDFKRFVQSVYRRYYRLSSAALTEKIFLEDAVLFTELNQPVTNATLQRYPVR